jgi:formylmethanofuran dehydrogenase subunit E
VIPVEVSKTKPDHFMISDHAIIKREGFKVPLIGVPPESVLQECDLCHEEKPIREVALQENGQMLCVKCRKLNHEK